MFTLMTASTSIVSRRSEPSHGTPSTVTQWPGPQAPPRRQRTFMDIFACKQCKKSKHRRNSRYADNEGYSSTEEDYYSPPQQLNVIANVPIATKSTKEPQQGSLRRPLTCKLPFGKRQLPKKDHKPKSSTEETPGTSFRETWRSLPNLRSPSLAVRAMTIKFRALTGKDSDNAKSKTKKRARFNEDVDVILTDDEGNPLSTQCVKIKFDDDSNSNFDISKMASANDQVNGCDPCVPSPSHRSPSPGNIRMDFMDIKRQADGQKVFKCVIFIGEEFDRRTITVRTAMGGSRLVLIAFKAEPLGDGTHYLRQFVEKFRLPHAIDPNQVNATMHAGGDLVIEAPLFGFDPDT